MTASIQENRDQSLGVSPQAGSGYSAEPEPEVSAADAVSIPNAADDEPMTPRDNKVSYCAIVSQRGSEFRLHCAQGNAGKESLYYWHSGEIARMYPNATIALWQSIDIPLDPSLRRWTKWDRFGDVMLGLWLGFVALTVVTITASAIEAATAAETAQTGSVHESATAKPGRPESGQ